MNLLRRTRALAFIIVAFAILAALFVAERTARSALRAAADGLLSAADTQQLTRALGDGFVAAAIVGLLLAGVAALVAGVLLNRPLARFRAETLARARGSATPFSDPAIQELRGVVSAVDLLATELRARNDALARERDELALLVSSVSEGILQIDADGRVVHANPAAHALLGFPDTVRGLPLASLIRNVELRSVLERAAAGRDVGTCEISMDERRLLVAARPLRAGPGAGGAGVGVGGVGGVGGAGGVGGGAVVAFADLTQIRRLEGVRRDFVANVSHELKTPLTSIRGYVETLLSDDLPVEMQRQFLEVVSNNADRLHRIVDDLLDLSRLESGGWRPELQQVDALRMAEDASAACRDSAERKRIACRTEGERVSTVADPAGLRQILSNLLDNAIRYTHEGGHIVLRVRRGERPARHAPRNGARRQPLTGDAPASAPGSTPASAPPHDPDAWVVIEVQDNGAGIPQDALGRIFERFYRVDPARSRAAGGTGLGLSIVKHLAERMGGDVAAFSELGKGTTIRVRLPAA